MRRITVKDGLQDPIRDLGLLGDRRTAALVDGGGDIVWYCPGRFDRPSLFARLLDPDGGSWSVGLPRASVSERRYLGQSGVLETTFLIGGREWTTTDFMPLKQAAPAGLICRKFSLAPNVVHISLDPRPDYAREAVSFERRGNAIVLNERWWIYASDRLRIHGRTVLFDLPAGHEGWMVLADQALARFGAPDVEEWLDATLSAWSGFGTAAAAGGSYGCEVAASLRALRMLQHEDCGGIVAAATTSLPERPGGHSNWDYRYVWLRDAAMIVSALIRAGGGMEEGERFLGFICSSSGSSDRYPVPALVSLDKIEAPKEEVLAWAGQLSSRPVHIGNRAREQIQFDGFGNVLLAAKQIYHLREDRPHWQTVAAIADYVAERWRDSDHGIWEETVTRQYTVGKVIVACGLDSLASFAPEAQAQRWRSAVRDIRGFVAERCLTAQGAYAVHPGSQQVDVSAALFPIWGFTAADAPEMCATMVALERDHSWKGLLYWRHLECSDAKEEGAFLAGTLWVAQYWVMRGELGRVRAILETALAYANDLGLFAEEADPRNGRMLGNIPQAFVHAAFIGAVVDLQAAEKATTEGEVQ